MSLEDLAFASRGRNGKGGVSVAYVGRLERGEKSPGAETIRALARGLDVPPETFPEYRLAQVRRLFDERDLGLDQAVTNLRVLETVFDGVSDPAEEFARALGDAGPEPGPETGGRAEKRRATATKAADGRSRRKERR